MCCAVSVRIYNHVVIHQFVEGKLADTVTITDTSILPENKSLNRLQRVLPDDKYRIYLNSRDGQTYINAVRINVSNISTQSESM